MANCEDNLMWIASIDIGSKNFAFYVEEVDVGFLSKIKNIQSSSRYNLDGTPTLKMSEILKNMFKNKIKLPKTAKLKQESHFE